MKSKLEIYALAVCFASVVCIVISAGIGGYSLLEMLAPKLTMSSYQYDRLQTNELYWKDSELCCAGKEKNAKKLSQDELTKKRLEAYSLAIEGESRRGLQSLMRSLIFVLVGGVALFIHWRIAKAARE